MPKSTKRTTKSKSPKKSADRGDAPVSRKRKERGHDEDPVASTKSRKKSQSKSEPKIKLQEVKLSVWKGPKTSNTTFLLAHGAGGKSDSPPMIRYRELLLKLGTVLQFDYPGMRLDSYTNLHISAIRSARQLIDDKPLVLVGNSMGCRGSVNAVNALHQLGADDASALVGGGGALGGVRAMVMFAYPLIPLPHPSSSAAQRTSRVPPLEALPRDLPVLFCSGTRDSFIDSDMPAFRTVITSKVGSKAEIHAVEGANHGLKVSGGQRKQEEVEQGLLRRVHDFLAASGLTVPPLPS